MATTFPQQIQTFPTLQNITVSDAQAVTNYQNAMKAGNLVLASQILNSIQNGQNKIFTADLLNTIMDTVLAVEEYFTQRYSPAVVVSEIEPPNQASGDFWWEIIASR